MLCVTLVHHGCLSFPTQLKIARHEGLLCLSYTLPSHVCPPLALRTPPSRTTRHSIYCTRNANADCVLRVYGLPSTPHRNTDSIHPDFMSVGE